MRGRTSAPAARLLSESFTARQASRNPTFIQWGFPASEQDFAGQLCRDSLQHRVVGSMPAASLGGLGSYTYEVWHTAR